MSLFAELNIPVDDFPLSQTLTTIRETSIEIERVIATNGTLAPYFWVATPDFQAFERVAGVDSTITNLEQLDEFDESALYRADWEENVEPLTYGYTELNAGLLEAHGGNDGWQVRFQFDEREQLQSFCDHCDEIGVHFSVSRLHAIERPEPGGQYGLTQKQEEALVTAWEMGFFDSPRTATLETVAQEIDITPQSLSERIKRGTNNWIADALVVEPTEVTAD